jgi:tripeptidyl-peptidase-2
LFLGSGDVPLQPVAPVEAPAHASQRDQIFLPSITGRLLSVSPSWKNPKNEWRVGYKRAWDFWPPELVTRRKEERRRAFERKHNQLLVQAQKELVQFTDAKKKATAASPTSSSESEGSRTPSSSTTAFSLISGGNGSPDKEGTEKAKEKWDKEKEQDLKARVDALNELKESREDFGPVLEVVAWHDGDNWRAVVGGAEGEGDDDPVPVAPSSEKEKFVLDLSGALASCA